jgi:hypothetical protein
MGRHSRSASIELERVYGHETAARLSEAALLRDPLLRHSSWGLLAAGWTPKPPDLDRWRRAGEGLTRAARADGWEHPSLAQLRVLLAAAPDHWPLAHQLLIAALGSATRAGQKIRLGSALLADRRALEGRAALLGLLEAESGTRTQAGVALGLAAWGLLVGESELCGELAGGLVQSAPCSRLQRLRALALSLCAGAERATHVLLQALERAPGRPTSSTERHWLAALARARADESQHSAAEVWPSTAPHLRDLVRFRSQKITTPSPLGALCRALLPG